MDTYKRGMKKYAHYKIDGHSLRVVKDQFGAIRCYTSLPTDVTKTVGPRIISPGMLSLVPNGTVLLGELWTPEGPASLVKTAIKDAAIELLFSCWAVETLPNGMGLDELNATLLRWGVRSIPYCLCNRNSDGPREFMKKPLLRYRGRQIEGYVFKDGQLLNLEKWKPIKTLDCVITGFLDGKGKYLGLMGSLKVSIEGHEVATVSGMTDAMRYEISADEERYIGQVVEVAYQSIGSKGRLRHPRFVRFRDDKRADECFLNQDRELT